MSAVQGNIDGGGSNRRETAVDERKQEGDDRHDSKVSRRLVGTTCLPGMLQYSYRNLPRLLRNPSVIC